jgi:hypothetical protein
MCCELNIMVRTECDVVVWNGCNCMDCWIGCDVD